MNPPRSRLALALALFVTLGAVAGGCGPKQKFCPDAGDGVCPTPMDAKPPVDLYEAPSDKGSIFVGADAGTD
jgi:hypothetical protein